MADSAAASQPDEQAQAPPALPRNWTAVESTSRPGHVYFYNVLSRATRWEQPTERPAPEQIRARHVLVKHRDVRNPVSRPKGNAKVTMTREEALAKIQGLLAEIQNEPSSFEAVAARESDCTSGKRGGNLGKFGRSEMTPEFSDAAFELDENELSGVVESPSGYHVIQRMAL